MTKRRICWTCAFVIAFGDDASRIAVGGVLMSTKHLRWDDLLQKGGEHS